ncbi:MAG: molybdenum cofactor guanylyltransferase [Synergistaceae bacterium]|nr:molybdenum cofactor guanylyltransferase [Synergistaceae bacterium]
MKPPLHNKTLVSTPVSSTAHKERLHASLLLLAGGQGSRMGGRNKLYLELEGSLLIEGTLEIVAPLFKEVILLVAPGESSRVKEALSPLVNKWNIAVVEDRVRAKGPLEGLYNGLRHMKEEWGFLLGCDMPSPDPDVIKGMSCFCSVNNDAVVAERKGFLEPLHAFYRKSCICAVSDAMQRGDRRIKQFYSDIRLTVINEKKLQKFGDEGRSFFNLNTPHDVEKMKLSQEVR